MAAAVFELCASLFMFLFFLFTVVTANENTTSSDFNTTVSDEQNITANVTEFFTWTPPPPSSSGPPPSSSGPPPSSSGPPLLPGGRLPAPVTDVSKLCPCDENKDLCDINCCCDQQCRQEVALFSSCSTYSVSGNKQLCSQEVAYYSLSSTADGYSVLQSSVEMETNDDIFCIQSDNRVNGFSHRSPPLPTDSNFDSLFQRFTGFVFGSGENSGKVSTTEEQVSSGYLYGDVMMTAGQSEDRDVFWLPAAGVTADCVDMNPAAFLKDQRSRCVRRAVLEQACGTLPSLSIDTYTNIQLFAGKNKDAAVIPMEVVSVVLQSLNGTQTEVELSVNETLSPVLLSPNLCANVVLKVGFVVKYNSAGEIVNAVVSVVLGFVRDELLPLEQEFHVMFAQEDGEQVAVHYSGNPGYVVGLPVLSGKRAADGIVRSVEPTETLSLLSSSEDQDCLRGRHQHSPVLFGVDSVSGCTLKLEDAANCSLVSQVLLSVLRGPDYPQYVAAFGSSPLNNPMDWVPISKFSPEESQSCSIPLSLHLVIKWTKYGSLVNPQAQIVSIKEVIHTNTSTLALLSGGSSTVTVRTSVAFVSVSAAALPGFRATPTIDAKLPFDFFFPFV